MFSGESSQNDEKNVESLSDSKLSRKRPQVAMWQTTLLEGNGWSLVETRSGETLPFDSVDELIMCITSVLTEEPKENSKRHIAVYQSLAGFLGYRERTQLPSLFQWGMNLEFPDVHARYVGFQA
ncbi:hypothetical protein R1sor_018426 [Riccia sorocarpa]|uniref:Uncharacterized protein n=1 Tax=Riccia sorocarpa TaxID=122646 RepID=A0ABD3IBC0_9MARC